MDTHDYRAIEVIPGTNCHCALSKQAGKRILYSEFLELFTGSDLSCTCTFKHFDDRRHIPDRRKFDLDSLISNPHSRTRPYGRRKVDIHNLARDPFAKIRMEAMNTTLQQVGIPL